MRKEALHRDLNYRLIELHLLNNDRILAVKYYEAYRNHLEKTLNQVPDQGIKDLLEKFQERADIRKPKRDHIDGFFA